MVIGVSQPLLRGEQNRFPRHRSLDPVHHRRQQHAVGCHGKVEPMLFDGSHRKNKGCVWRKRGDAGPREVSEEHCTSFAALTLESRLYSSGGVAFGCGEKYPAVRGAHSLAADAVGFDLAGVLCSLGLTMEIQTEASEESSGQGALEFVLSGVAARALGCLIEKEFATPDIYPLSLNALTNACNQRSNREPVMALSEADVLAGLDELRVQKLAVIFTGADSRVPKYKHRLDQVFPMDDASRGLLCELLVRGPQTAASLRANSERLCRQPGPAEVDVLLAELAERRSGALVQKLHRQVGQKEARWGQMLTGAPALQTEPETVVRPVPSDLERRVADLEELVRRLSADLAGLRAELGVGTVGETAERVEGVEPSL
jgi:uncharacterized protein YceH (UPF0502 family)